MEPQKKKKKKKICMVLKKYWYGFTHDRRVIKEAKALSDAGYDVSVVIIGKKDDKYMRFFGGIKVPIVHIESKLSTLTMKNHYIDILEMELKYFFLTLLRLLSEDADVYHAHDFETLEVSFLASSLRNSLLVYDSHEFFLGSSQLYIIRTLRMRKPILKLKERIFSRAADAVITVNNSIARLLSETYGLNRVYVVRNTVDFSPPKKTDILKKELGLDSRDKIALYHGGLTLGRGLFNLIESAKFLKSNIKIVIMGYGPLKDGLKRKIVDMGLSDKVFIRDAVPYHKVVEYVASADIEVAPIENICLSYYLSTPNKIYEAIAAGIPFAVSDFPEMRKMAIDEDMGVVFDEKNPRSIAEAINTILSNEELYARKRKNVIKNFREKYNWDIDKKVLLDLYDSLPYKDVKRAKFKRIMK